MEFNQPMHGISRRKLLLGSTTLPIFSLIWGTHWSTNNLINLFSDSSFLYEVSLYDFCAESTVEQLKEKVTSVYGETEVFQYKEIDFTQVHAYYFNYRDTPFTFDKIFRDEGLEEQVPHILVTIERIRRDYNFPPGIDFNKIQTIRRKFLEIS